MMRKYKLSPDKRNNIYVGRTLDGHQYLISRSEQTLVVIQFSADGIVEKIFDEKSLETITLAVHERMADSWIRKLNLNVEMIEIQKFYLERFDIGIHDMPSYIEKYVLDKTSYSDENRNDNEDFIERWTANQYYILDAGRYDAGRYGKGITNFWLDKWGKRLTS